MARPTTGATAWNRVRARRTASAGPGAGAGTCVGAWGEWARE